MDLLGAFFFSGVVIIGLKEDPSLKGLKSDKQLIKVTLKAGLIGAFLLGIIYVGFSYVAAFNSELLGEFGQDELLGALALKLLGPSAAIVAIVAVALACLTTAIALAAVFAEFLCKEVCNEKINYLTALVITLVVSYFISTLQFTGIAAFLVPILQVCYPALIMLCLVNIAHKLYHFNAVVIPVVAVFLISLINFLL
jgi:branched-chain amino acid:cation transporter, LIVCS family